MIVTQPKPNALNGRSRRAAGGSPSSLAGRALDRMGRGISRDAFGSPLFRFIWIDMAFGDPGLIPECLSNAQRINTGCLPPGLFVPNAMHFAVMHPAKRDGELITRFAAE